MNLHELSADEPLARARHAVRGAERLVEMGSSGGLFAAAAELEAAVNACAEFHQQAAQLPPESRRKAAGELMRIRVGLSRVGVLINSAAGFHAGLARIADTRTSAYGPDGSELGLPAGIGRGSRCDANG
jgi:hypothetical protein